MWVVSLSAEQRYKMIIRSIHGAPNAACSSNYAAEVFLEDHPDAEWLCIVDNDSVPPDNVMRILDGLSDEICLIGAASYMMQNTKISMQQGHYGEDKIFHSVSLDPPTLMEVDRIGGGCWFIRRCVFDKMSKPYFLEVYDSDTWMTLVSDDIYFQDKARDLGFRLYCDTRFVTEHYHTIDLAKV